MLDLERALKDVQESPLKWVVQTVAKLVLSPAAAKEVNDQLASGELKLPGAEVLRVATIKLDMISSIYQRHLMESNCYRRYFSMDASFQSGYDWLIGREDRVSWKKGLLHAIFR